MQSLPKHSIVCACVHGICVPPSATPLEDNESTHTCAHLLSLHESALQNKSLMRAAAILSSLVQAPSCGVWLYDEISFARVKSHVSKCAFSLKCGHILLCLVSDFSKVKVKGQMKQ